MKKSKILVVPQDEQFNACGKNVSSDVENKDGGNPKQIQLFNSTQLQDLYQYSLDKRPIERIGHENVIRCRVAQAWGEKRLGQIRYAICGDAGGITPAHAQLVHMTRSKAKAAFAGEVCINASGKIAFINNQSGDFKLSSITMFFLIKSLYERYGSDVFADKIVISRLQRRERGMQFEDPCSEIFTKHELISIVKKMPSADRVKSSLDHAYEADLVQSRTPSFSESPLQDGTGYRKKSRRLSFLDSMHMPSAQDRINDTRKKTGGFDSWEAIDEIFFSDEGDMVDNYKRSIPLIIDKYKTISTKDRSAFKRHILTNYTDDMNFNKQQSLSRYLEQEIKKIDALSSDAEHSSGIVLHETENDTKKSSCCF